MIKTKIISPAESVFTRFTQTRTGIHETVFLNPEDEKCPVARNIQNQNISINIKSLSWYLPFFRTRYMAGMRNRNTSCWHVLQCHHILKKYALASNSLVSQPFDIAFSKQHSLEILNKAAAKWINNPKKPDQQKNRITAWENTGCRDALACVNWVISLSFIPEHIYTAYKTFRNPHDSVL